MRFAVISFISIILLPICCSYKVLIISPTPILSHAILSRAMIKLLMDAGFEVTFITAFVQRKVYPNLKQIYVSYNRMLGESEKSQSMNQMNAKERGERLLKPHIFSAMLQQTSVNKLLLNTTLTFDLVIAEWMFNGIFAGLAALYDCPLIWFGRTEPHAVMYELVGKIHISSVKMNDEKEKIAFSKIFEPLLAMRGKPLYSFDQLRSAASLVLLNSHGKINSEVPAWPKEFIPIAGFHVGLDDAQLDKRLKRVMDNAKQGVIYISLGMNIEHMDEPSKIKNEIMLILGNLKQTVIWQQELESRSVASNVIILNWSSQQSILSHPHCELFITHGGDLSTSEALYFGVPMIGLPLFGDQLKNIDYAIAKGVVKKVSNENPYLLVVELKNAMLDMLNNPSYRVKAKKLSAAYQHQSNKAKKDFIYWVNQTIQSSHLLIIDMGPLFTAYITFKSYILKGAFNVGIITVAVIILIPFSFKLLFSSHIKQRNSRKLEK